MCWFLAAYRKGQRGYDPLILQVRPLLRRSKASPDLEVERSFPMGYCKFLLIFFWQAIAFLRYIYRSRALDTV